MPFHVHFVTPEKTVFEQDADELIIPTTEGEIAVLPHHVSLLSQIAPGELVVKSDGDTKHFAVMGGFIEVSEGNVTILTDYAVAGEAISAVKAQEAKERAQRALKENLTNEDFAVVQGELQKAILELKVAEKIKRRAPLSSFPHK